MMKRLGGIAAAIGVAVTGFGVGLCEYRTPTTEFLQGKVSFFYQHTDDPTTPSVDLSSGWLSFDARRQYDSMTEGFTLAGSGQVGFAELSLTQAEVGASGAVRQYLESPLPLFTFGGFAATLDTAFPQPRVEAQAGLGYGRFYDVTPLAKALQIEGQLLTRGILPVPLTDENLLAVAKSIGQRVEGEVVAERVAAVVSLIEAEAGRELDPTTVLLIEEALAATGRERYCGWTVQAGFAHELLDPHGATRDFLLSLALDAALAPEPNSQLLFRARVSGPYWITEQYTLALDVTFDVQLDSAISFSTRYSLFQDKPLGQLPAGRQSASFQLEISQRWVGMTLQMEFAKLAEAPAWKQSIVITATAHLW